MMCKVNSRVKYSTTAKFAALQAAQTDMRQASFYAQHLQKKGWHHEPAKCRNSIYVQQSAYVTALMISYARPFTRNFGWPSLTKVLAPIPDELKVMHKSLITLRNQVYAHTDSSLHSVKAISIKSTKTAILGFPDMKLSAEQVGLTIKLINLMSGKISSEIQKTHAAAEAEA
jgi:hypothetical protein